MYETKVMFGHMHVNLRCNATFPSLAPIQHQRCRCYRLRLCCHHRFTNQWLNSWSVSRGGRSLALCHTHGMGWCASWWSGWKCCQGCGRGKRPWPRSARSARFSSATQSHNNPRNAHTRAEDDPGSWGISLLSSPSHQTPSQDGRKKQVRGRTLRSFLLNLELRGEIWP